ncbi:uncharacterized protein LOC143925642 [Lithobates pipiens]
MSKQQIIANGLSNLDAEELKTFKNALFLINLPRGKKQITMHDLEDKSLVAIAEFILACHTERHGTIMIYNALKKISKDDIVKIIQTNLRESAKGKRKMEYKNKKGMVRLVKQHALDLIREVIVVDPILNDLLIQKMLTEKQYNNLCSNTTSPKKMRELYKFVTTWQDDSKIKFYKSLMKFNEQLIKYLEHLDKPPPKKEHFVDRHWQKLFKKNMVDDLLADSLLTEEQCGMIRAQQQNQEKMRILYSFIRGWGNAQKDIFCNILKKHNAPIIRRLQEEDMNPSLNPMKKNFVDRHRQNLINWVYEIQPVLDSLLKQNLLTKQEYDSTGSTTTPQEKMTELYRVVGSWGDSDKDKLYESLAKYNRLLIRDLEYQDMKWTVSSSKFH